MWRSVEPIHFVTFERAQSRSALNSTSSSLSSSTSSIALPVSEITMSELCPVYAPFFGALVRFSRMYSVDGALNTDDTYNNRDAQARLFSLVSFAICWWK